MQQYADLAFLLSAAHQHGNSYSHLPLTTSLLTLHNSRGTCCMCDMGPEQIDYPARDAVRRTGLLVGLPPGTYGGNIYQLLASATMQRAVVELKSIFPLPIEQLQYVSPAEAPAVALQRPLRLHLFGKIPIFKFSCFFLGALSESKKTPLKRFP